jgi:hypothetical protein
MYFCPAPYRVQIEEALTSVSRRWRWRWSAGWLATVFVVDPHGEHCYVTEHSGWSRRATRRWIEQELNTRRDEAPFGGAQGWYYVATLERFPPPPKATAYLFAPDGSIFWGTERHAIVERCRG